MRNVWIALALLGPATVAWSQDQQLGARTKGMGGSYTAFEDDPVSIWLNPAGTATQPHQGAISYQTYTAYERGRQRGADDTLVFTVEPTTSFAEPEFWPSFLGFVFQVGTPELPQAIGICYARPYVLSYAMDLVTDALQTTFDAEAQLEESLSRFRLSYATDFIIGTPGRGGYLTHVSVGLALDIAFANWSFNGNGFDESSLVSALGGGAGLLVGLYDNTDWLRLNFGVAYQSAVKFDFPTETDILPAFDMPQQLNAGLTAYLLPKLPLRVTVDFQWIDWSETAEDPLFPGFEKFEDAMNYSVGLEYRLKVTDKVNVYPRMGYRRLDAPWGDPDDLPAMGSYRLVLDTKDEVFNILTFGLGLRWQGEAGKLRQVDFAVDIGGDAPNYALGLNYEF